jgi:transcriptional regulator with XRE-family HTH domain
VTPPSRSEAGRRLRALRTARALSGRELGRRAGVDQSVIVRVEQGRLRPSPDLLQRLLEALEAPSGECAHIVWGMALDPAFAHLVNTTPPPEHTGESP